MDVAVLLLFAFFITAVAVVTMTRTEVLRASVRRPRLFQGAVLGAAAATVPVDLYAVVYGTIGPGGTRLADVADRLLLLNVAAACGVAALHGCLRGRALAGSAPAATVAGAAAACSPGPPGSGSRPDALPGSGSGSGGQTDDRHALRMGVLGWIGPLIALVVVTAVVALGSGSASGGNGTGPGGVGATAGSALAIYSLLVCLISASSLFRGRPARVPGTRAGTPGSAIDPREG